MTFTASTDRHSARMAVYEDVSAALSGLSDAELRELVVTARPVGRGIGGQTALADVGGHRVFVKQIPVTDEELQAGNVGSTANLFDLPTFYQYGLGSAGFGAWRELAVHTMTTGWVRSGDYDGFPLTYHARVLSDLPRADVAPEGQFLTIDWFTERWDGSPAVRARLDALEQAPSYAVVLLEYIPQTLEEWITDCYKSGDTALDSALSAAATALEEGIAFMGSRGLEHFDAHRSNILTDGTRVYFADFGLALSSEFDLSPAESEFFTDHADYDWMLTMAELVNGIGAAVRGPGEFAAFALDYATAGARGNGNPDLLPSGALEVVRKYAPAAAQLNGFLRGLIQGSKSTPYPAEDFRRTRAAAR